MNHFWVGALVGAGVVVVVGGIAFIRFVLKIGSHW
jgi:hypothetical protein